LRSNVKGELDITDEDKDSCERKHARFAAAALTVREGLEKGKMRPRIACFMSASELFKADENWLFQARMTAEYVMLLEEQDKLNCVLAHVLKGDLRDMSLMDTIYKLCAAATYDSRCLEFASNLAHKFEVPEKLFYHTKAKALAHSHNWDELFRFSNLKMPPIGYAPFAKYCLDMGNKEEEARYANRVVDNDGRVKERKF
jgi:hypothetical protein